MATSIYVGNLSFTADQDSLAAMFSPFGEVLSANVITDRETGRSRGFGFVEMSSEDARKAIAALDGTEQGGRRLKVNEAQKKESQPRPKRY